jgi:O-antigen/teichoic acid export membrane protein
VTASDTRPPVPEDAVGRQARESLVAMSVRQVLSHGATYVAALALSRVLSADLFGLFIIAAPLWNALITLADFGVAAALVQREEEPEPDDWRALFGVALVAMAAVALALLAAERPLLHAYRLSDPAPLRAFAAVMCASMLRIVPATMLERALDFRSIARADAAGMVAYQAVLVGGVYAGAGLWALPGAASVRLVVELALLGTRRPWLWTPRPSWLRLRRLAAFGMGLQGIRALSVAKDNVGVILVAPLLGPTAFGELQWAIVYSGVAVYLTSLVARVAFPSVARHQRDPRAAADVLGLVLRFSVGLGLPLCLVLTVWAPFLVPVLYGERWLSAVPLVYALLPNMLGGLVAGTMVAALNAIGRIGTTVRLSVAWVLATYLLAAAAIAAGRGTLGVAVAFSLATTVASLAVHHLLRQHVPLGARAWLEAAMLAALPVVIGGLAVRARLVGPWLGLALSFAGWLIITLFTQRAALSAYVARAREALRA